MEEYTEEMRKARVREFMKSVTIVEAIALPPPQKDEAEKMPLGQAGNGKKINDEELEMLILIGIEYLPVTALYERQSRSRAKGKKILGSLLFKGLIALYKFTRSTRGGAITVPVPTEAGRKFLISRGEPLAPALLTKGWIEHNLAAYFIGKQGKEQNFKSIYEKEVEDVRFDVVWRGPMGQFIFHNIGVSNPEYEVQSVLKAARLPIATENNVILVVIDKDFARRVKAELKKKDPSGEALKKVTIRLIGDYIS